MAGEAAGGERARRGKLRGWGWRAEVQKAAAEVVPAAWGVGRCPDWVMSGVDRETGVTGARLARARRIMVMW